METKFKVGDQVKIINYGHPIWAHNSETMPISFPVIWVGDDTKVYDMSPELIGQTGVIDKVNITQGKDGYSINGINGKLDWYNNDQLEFLIRPDYITKNEETPKS